MTSPTAADFHAVRAQYKGLVETCHKQMGLRSIRNGLLLLGRNDVEVMRCMTNAKFHLPYAQAYDERAKQDAA